MIQTHTRNVSAFEALDNFEMMVIAGGFTWRGFLGSVIGGGITGGLGGVVAGGVGAVPGAISGALLGGISYCIADLIGE